MSKQKHRDRGKQGLTVKKRAGRRTFGYQVPQNWPASGRNHGDGGFFDQSRD